MRTHTKIDLHSHTRNSDGHGTPAQIALAARKAGLDFLALTDHHQNVGDEVLRVADALLDVGVTPILGCEYSTNQNHLLVFGMPVLPESWGRYPDVQAVVNSVNSQGGACIMAHPFKGYSRSIKQGVELITGLAAVETLNGQVEHRTPEINQKAQRSAERMGVAQTGASDAHVPEDIGSTFTLFDGDLRTVGDVLAVLRTGRGFRPMRNEAMMTAWRAEEARYPRSWKQQWALPRTKELTQQDDSSFLKGWSDSWEED